MLHSFIFSQLSHFGEKGRKDPVAMLHLLLILFSFLLSLNGHSLTAGGIVCPNWVASAFLMHLLEILCTTYSTSPPSIRLLSSKWLLLFQLLFPETRAQLLHDVHTKWRAAILLPHSASCAEILYSQHADGFPKFCVKCMQLQPETCFPYLMLIKMLHIENLSNSKTPVLPCTDKSLWNALYMWNTLQWE